MKKLLIPLLCLLGCDDRLASFDDAFDVDFSINGGITEGRVKMGLKSGDGIFHLNITTTNVSEIRAARFEVDEGEIEVYQNGVQKTGALDLSSNMQLEVRFITSSAATITIILFDQLGGRVEKSLRIIVAQNLSPVALMSFSKLSQNDPREYEFSGSNSYDADADLGGEVAYYEWTIGGVVFVVDHAAIRYIFPNSGTYIVRLRVRDNDGAWSTQISENVSVD